MIFCLSFQASAAEPVDISWRTISGENEASDWTTSQSISVGFTSDLLEGKIDLSNSPTDEKKVLLVSPTFLDQVEVFTLTASGRQNSFKFGDKIPSSSNVSKVAGQYVVMLPDATDQVFMQIRSTSSLSIRALVGSEKSTQQVLKAANFSQGAVLALLLAATILGAVAYVATRSIIALAFSCYQATWVFLITGIQGPVPIKLLDLPAHWHDLQVSYGAIMALITGAICHAVIFRKILKIALLERLLVLSALLGAVYLGMLIAGYEREALQLNVLTILLVPLVVIVTLLISKVDAQLRRIKFLYLILMFSVTLTGLSGIGLGSLFNITYIHALLTTVILSTVLFLAQKYQSAQMRAEIQHNQLEKSRRKLVEEQLAETTAMFEMLSHEIKTPLTTLSMLLHKFPDRDRAAKQIGAIQTIIEQTALAMNVPDRQPSPDMVTLQPAIISNWRLCADLRSSQLLDVKVDPMLRIFVDRFLLDILLRNLIKNAVKYGANGKSVRIYTKLLPNRLLLVFSNASKVAYAEKPDFFTKYWRAAESKNSRGSGLGLWIVRRICDISGFTVEAQMRGPRFRLVIEVPIPKVSTLE